MVNLNHNLFIAVTQLTAMKLSSEIIKLAAKQSLKSTMKYQIGAVVFHHSTIINTGHNQWLLIGSRTERPFRCSIHAEAAALIGCSLEELYGASILVFRKGYGLARPCSACTALIAKCGLSWVYYSNGEDGIDCMEV